MNPLRLHRETIFSMRAVSVWSLLAIGLGRGFFAGREETGRKSVGKGFFRKSACRLVGDEGRFGVATIASVWNSPEVVLPDEHAGLRRWLEGRREFENHVIFRTSGSSGVEKWVALSKPAMEWSARQVINFLGMQESDVCGLALPMVHVGGWGLALRAYLCGARLAEYSGKWDPVRYRDWCFEEEVSICSLVPTQVRDLVRAGVRAPAWMRVIVVGGGELNQQLAVQGRELGWPVEPSYGMTETSSQIATGDGLPLMEGWDARVDGGCLAIKGGGLFSAVITRVDDEFLATDPKVDGWFLTSDRVKLVGRNLQVLGRSDRQVKVLGELVDLTSLEEFWREKLGQEVALVAGPDERRGAGLVLFVEGDDRLVEELNQGLPGPERLVGWKVLEVIPRSPLGKVDRVKLNESLAELRCFAGTHREG